MLWGVAGALLANVLYSAGFVLEKRALARMPPLRATSPARLLRHVLGSPLWLGGAVALALGFGAQLLVYRKLPIAAAQGLFVSGLVLLVVLSSVVLGERIGARERRGVALILVSLAMVVASLRGGEDIGRTAPTGVLLAVCGPSLAAALGVYAAAERRAARRHRLPTAGVAYGVAIGLLYGVSSLAIKGVSGLLGDGGPTSPPAALAASPYPYLLLVTGATGLVLSQAALQRCRASLLVPVCTTVTCVFTVVCGTAVFGEPLPADPVRLALRLGGTALAVGVLLTLPRHEEETGPPGSTGPAPGPYAREPAPHAPGAGDTGAGAGDTGAGGPLPARRPLSPAHTLGAASPGPPGPAPVAPRLLGAS
ncbi:hypothetical protein [Streptomyces pactum]|uniref:hypothetical protein n=1 Tax=Streptomyces pactum TaxID=68249 RepID=UPI0027DD986F|nr:hypothetical protein [Streptomyces pactum]